MCPCKHTRVRVCVFCFVRVWKINDMSIHEPLKEEEYDDVTYMNDDVTFMNDDRRTRRSERRRPTSMRLNPRTRYACARACMRARARACVRTCVFLRFYVGNFPPSVMLKIIRFFLLISVFPEFSLKGFCRHTGEEAGHGHELAYVT